MKLWQVRVDVVSNRYVEADTEEEAIGLVRDSLIAAIDLVAQPANPTLQDAYDAASPAKRRRLVIAMDSLTSPLNRHEGAAAKRRLIKLVEAEEASREWVKKTVAKAPPPPHPDGLEQMLRTWEVRRIESNFRRMKEWERRSPLHE